LIRELAQMTGVTVRTLRNYVAQGLLEPIEFRGTATRYSRRQLLYLLAMMRARKESKLALAEIKKRLDVRSESELEAWVKAGPLPPAAAAALGVVQQASEANANTAAEAATAGRETGLEQWAQQLESWRRVELLPGLELLLGPSASPAALRAAQAICREYLR
jgi:DNA-binding transcriptional MerR regulator